MCSPLHTRGGKGDGGGSSSRRPQRRHDEPAQPSRRAGRRRRSYITKGHDLICEAVGRSRGGRTTKLHALTDAEGRPRVLMPAPGNLHDVTLAPELLRAAGSMKRLIADEAYDTNGFRDLLAA